MPSVRVSSPGARPFPSAAAPVTFNEEAILVAPTQRTAPPMHWLQSEYLLKGLFLGLLLFVALQEAVPPQPQAPPPGWPATARVTLITLGGLALALGIAAVRKRR